METRRGTIAGPLIVDRELSIHGTIAGHARVRPSGSLQLRGVITGDLTVEPGATAVIYGSVMGQIHKTGGTLVIAHPAQNSRDAPSNSANSSTAKL
jgi:cytoskeletal protein CcmA (bactofilin family)